MRRVGLAAFVAERRRRIREVELDALDARTEDRDQRAGLRALRHGLERGRLDLQVPRVVDASGLKERARRRIGITAALERDRFEERFVWITEIFVQVVRDDITSLEVTDLVWPRADRLPVRLAARRLRADAPLVLVLLEDRAFRPDSPLEDERVWCPVRAPRGVGVTGHDALNAVAPIESRGRRQGVALVLMGEGHVVGREGRPVRPLQVLAKLPGHAREVFRDATVGQGRDLGRESIRDRLAILTE